MVSLLSSPCTFTINVDRIVEALGKALGFVDERTQSFDWLAYYRSISEWRRARDEERLFRWFYINYEFQTFEPFDYLLVDFVARIRALRERMWRMFSRTSQCEGRFESLLASMPTPPTINAAGRLTGYTYVETSYIVVSHGYKTEGLRTFQQIQQSSIRPTTYSRPRGVVIEDHPEFALSSG